MAVAAIELTEGRRSQIVALIGILDEGLPEPVRRDGSSSGFVNEPRSRTCPDCLANGKVPTRGCETCGGGGTVSVARLDAISLPDMLDTDGSSTDPYAVNQVQPYGVGQTTKLGHQPTRDAEIDRMAEQLREPWRSPADEIAEANRTPYPWERERARLRRRYDLPALERALDELRMHDSGLAALILSVYGRRLEGIPNLIEPSATFEAGVDRALRFLSDLLPAELRAPGDAKPPALKRWDRKHAA